MNLTTANYHSPEANNQYLSCHQFSDWLDCPARTAAGLRGEWKRRDTDALLIGSLVDLMLLTPEDVDAFVDDHEADLYGKPKKDGLRGAPKAALMVAERCVKRAQADPTFMQMLEGRPQVIVTGEFFGCGVEWKCMMDVILDGERVVDLKTTASTSGRVWCEVVQESPERFATIFDRVGERVSGERITIKNRPLEFYDAYNYFRQASVYLEAVEFITGDRLPFLLACIGKEDGNKDLRYEGYNCNGLRIISMSDDYRLQYEYDIIARYLPQVMKWKSGEETPPRCLECDYCRALSTASVEEAKSGLYV